MRKDKKKQPQARKDTFYRRAKEQGYRARSAFKLVHINNIHGVLKNAKVCLDLCAAPGSWMQVAREYMPTGSVIVGVDLFKIKPIPGTIALQGDITTDSLRAELRSTLKEFKADVVLHDGAPNVGGNWPQDSYHQNLLVLHAFKLACEFLRPGGDFITKVFRCKDSASLEYVFKALFKKVESTKPLSSRYESAEIFYVCRHLKLKDGDKADPKFFDPKEVFHEVDKTTASKINIHKPDKVKKKAVGYEDGVEVLFKETTVTQFVECDNYVETLSEASALVFDDNKWLEHPLTSNEIVSCCQDIKVLGRKELKSLLNWRKKLRKELDEERQVIEAATQQQVEASEEKEEEEETEEGEADQVKRQIEELQEEKRKEDKKRMKAINKQKRELKQSLKMLQMSGYSGPPESHDYFNIKDMEKIEDVNKILEEYDHHSDDDVPTRPKVIKFRKGEHELDDSGKHYRNPGDCTDSESEEEVPDVGEGLFAKKKLKKFDGIEIVPKDDMSETQKKSVRFATGTKSDDSDSDDSDDEDTKSSFETKFGSETGDSGVDEEQDDDEVVGEKYTTDLMGDKKLDAKVRTAESWFSQDIFEDVNSDAEEDLDLDAAVDKYKRSGGKILGAENKEIKENETKKPEHSAEEPEVPKQLSSADQLRIFRFITKEQVGLLEMMKSKMNEVVLPGKINPVRLDNNKHLDSNSKVPDINTIDMSSWGEDFAESKATKRLPDLDAVGLAVAAQMIKTKKSRRDFELDGWNRYMKGDEPGLPEWFVKEETEHMAPMNINVNPEEVSYYKAREAAFNVRTIKKVMEAKVRKQRRMKKTMQKIIKKTEAMQGSSLLTEYEKQQEIKNMYKKALKATAKKDTTYVVMSKKNQGKAPQGIKGRYKLVDPRLKSDVRAKMKSAKKKKTMGRGKKK